MSEKQSNKSNRGGKRNGAGRPAGAPNKLSAAVKDNIIEVFERIGGVESMAAWATENQTQFFNLYAKLLPLQVNADVTATITKVERVIVRPSDTNG
jgi:hypothetical protein